MSKVFAIADLHLGHEKVALARGFHNTIQHNNAIIDNWNSVVGKRDSVFVLGDVVFGDDNFKLLAYLNGTKKLILGNHDNYPIRKYLPYFSQVFGCVRYKEHILTHIPIHESEFGRWKGNIHGHLHDKVVTKEQYYGFPEYMTLDLPDERYKCVSAEQINLTPIAFEELLGDNYA